MAAERGRGGDGFSGRFIEMKRRTLQRKVKFSQDRRRRRRRRRRPDRQTGIKLMSNMKAGGGGGGSGARGFRRSQRRREGRKRRTAGITRADGGRNANGRMQSIRGDIMVTSC